MLGYMYLYKKKAVLKSITTTFSKGDGGINATMVEWDIAIENCYCVIE